MINTFPYAIIKEPSINKANLFRGLRGIWGKTNDPEDIISTLDYYSAPYIAISTGSYPDGYGKPVRKILDRLVKSKSPTPVYPFVMKLLKEYELDNLSESKTVETLEALESFLVRRAVSGIEPTGLLALFRTAWNVMEGNPSKDGLNEAIRKRGTIEWPDDERFRTSILTRNVYASHICKYVLGQFEESIGADLPENDFWIEHVMPQSLNADWKKVVSVEDQSLVHTLGNLVPLTKEMNRGLFTV